MKAGFKNKTLYRIAPCGKFELEGELIFYSAMLGRDITAPDGFLTDFASIPWVLRSIIKVNGKHRRAAVIHDYLCEHGKEEGITQKQADKVFHEAMKVLDVRVTKRRVMYRGVRIYQSISGFFKGIFK